MHNQICDKNFILKPPQKMNLISISMREVFIKQVNNSLVRFNHILGLFL